MTDPRLIRPVILAGGSGTRLWPLSRASHPKQFTPLMGDETLFQDAVRRVTGDGFTAPIIVTAEPFRFVVLEQLDDIGVKAATVLIEPVPKNTGPAVAAALSWMERHDPDGIMLVTPSDHAIKDAAGFRKVVRGAVAAAQDHIVTFGITPTHAETGYGWLELDDTTAPTREGLQDLVAFVEKPSSDVAAEMLAAGHFLWNAGLFLASAVALRLAYSSAAPEMLALAKSSMEFGQSGLDFFRLNSEHWSEIESISIDHAVMEKTADLKVQPRQKGWSDLGGWDAVARTVTAIAGDVTQLECQNSYLSAEEGVRLVAIGLQDMIAVAMQDAVLVAPRSAAHKVGQVVRDMQADAIPQATEFPKEYRPWGWFETLVLGDRFRVKRIVVKPGGRLSLQSHTRRAEHWVVVEGTVYVTIAGERRRLGENQSLYVPVQAQHRLENEGSENAVLIEVQTGGYLGEDDIVRYDDVYSRE